LQIPENHHRWRSHSQLCEGAYIVAVQFCFDTQWMITLFLSLLKRLDPCIATILHRPTQASPACPLSYFLGFCFDFTEAHSHFM